MFKHEKEKQVVSFIFIGIALFTLNAEAASKAESVREGNESFKKQDYATAVKKYTEALKKDAESPVINFNLGTAYYKKGNFADAFEPIEKALLSEDPKIKERANYNLGNASYKAGITKEDKDLKQAIEQLKKSLSRFEDALKLDKEDADAKFNEDFVKKEIERLEKKMKMQKQQSQQNQNQKNQDKNNQQNQQDRQSEEQKDKDHSKNNQNSSQDSEKNQNSEYNKSPKDKTEKANPQSLTKKEAQMILDDYQQTEEPKKLLNIQRQTMQTKPVLKDW